MDWGDSVRIKFRKLSKEASSPARGSQYEAGWELTATSVVKEKGIITYGTDISVEIPEGYFGIIAAPSSIYLTDLGLANSPGIINSSYRGELIFKYRLLSQDDYPKMYRIGDRVGQIAILSYAAPEWAEADIIEPKD